MDALEALELRRINSYLCDVFLIAYFGDAALLLELEKRINEVPIESELGFTRPGTYIYEFLAEMKITYETVSMLIDTIDQATALLEDGMSLTSCYVISVAVG